MEGKTAQDIGNPDSSPAELNAAAMLAVGLDSDPSDMDPEPSPDLQTFADGSSQVDL